MKIPQVHISGGAKGNLAFVAFYSLLAIAGSVPRWAIPLVFVAPVACFVAYALIHGARYRYGAKPSDPQMRRAFQENRSWSEIRSLWQIVEAPETEPVLRRQALTRLRHNVKRLTAEALAEMPSRDRDTTYNLLIRSDDEVLVRSLIASLVRLTADDALPRLRQLAGGYGELGKQYGLRSVARQTAEAIARAAEAREETGLLLRPSAAPADSTLLRPAGGAPDRPGEHLLRPAEPDAGDETHQSAPNRA